MNFSNEKLLAHFVRNFSKLNGYRSVKAGFSASGSPENFMPERTSERSEQRGHIGSQTVAAYGFPVIPRLSQRSREVPAAYGFELSTFKPDFSQK